MITIITKIFVNLLLVNDTSMSMTVICNVFMLAKVSM